MMISKYEEALHDASKVLDIDHNNAEAQEMFHSLGGHHLVKQEEDLSSTPCPARPLSLTLLTTNHKWDVPHSVLNRMVSLRNRQQISHQYC